VTGESNVLEGLLSETGGGEMLDPDVLRKEVIESLSASPPNLPPKLFYDDVGAHLFEEITRLPEYYPTRTEVGILEAHLPAMARRAGPGVRVVEFGSGSGEKTELLLRALDEPQAYIPMDIAREQLVKVASRLDRSFPGLAVRPMAADYTRPFRLPRPATASGVGTGRPFLFFPGSTIGNFEPPDARNFLRRAGESLGEGATLLIGVDLVKSAEILEPAYDDARGVTAEFNRNALVHLNRLLGADFQPEAFRHRAPWNEEASRVEMHLVATEPQVVTLPDRRPEPTSSGNGSRSPTDFRLALDEGDHIVTEHSYKYTPEGFHALTRAAGWVTLEYWSDPRHWFAGHFLEWKGSSHDQEQWHSGP
jgi:L-histidine Nalpha-methyltransferase